jgi:hypothetical protein
MPLLRPGCALGDCIPFTPPALGEATRPETIGRTKLSVARRPTADLRAAHTREVHSSVPESSEIAKGPLAVIPSAGPSLPKDLSQPFSVRLRAFVSL